MPSSRHRSQRFLEQISQQVLVGDGAMGTLLYSRGIQLDTNFEYLNLRDPEQIRRVHGDYLAAGAQLLETNTFGANALRLAGFGLDAQVRDINLAGARLAREVAGDQAFVAGSVGPLARPRGEVAVLPRSQKEAVLRQQMEALAEGGVDLFILETFSDLDDLELGLELAKGFGLPAIAQMAFLQEGRTRDGVSAEVAAGRLTAAGAAVLGANCGSGPRELLQVVSRMAAASKLPLSAFPNSGFPEFVDGRYIYLATPEYFAAMGRELAAVGAGLVGGCCGTTPEHIRALAQALEGLRPAAVSRAVKAPEAEVARPAAAVSEKNFLCEWGRRPVVTVELDPPRGLNCDKVLAGARALAAAGVDAISLAENPLARIRLGNIALANTIQQATGTEVIVHVTCRDRNLIGLHSELMGAHLLGIRNVLAVTGDPVAVGGESGATSVFDLNSIGLLELLNALNNGKNSLGAELEGQTRFLLGAAFNPNLPSMDGQLRRLGKKMAAGARFVQTQPVYSIRVMEEMLERTADLDIPVLVGILPLVSERNAEFLHNEVPGITLPDEVRMRMRGKQGAEGVREGMSIARELVEAGRGKVGGYYLMPPFGKVELALELMEFIRRSAA
ncbi:bifunctional homocysteine S-methyltransferase/methylenetetrahydrofolate reductase [Trichloromonas sp.]|uniref:bifunctional homocysteine S-methyltransferase/methylenetetrahydrofolate reductase n=1 Tax=Trichloromonas sp. TaxID=3069249 RepID=UPI003D81B64C